MALQKEYTTKGISCNYWKLVAVSTDSRNNITLAELALYGSKNARDLSVNNDIERRNFIFNQEDLTRSEVYALIKLEATDENGFQNSGGSFCFFSDALDV